MRFLIPFVLLATISCSSTGRLTTDKKINRTFSDAEVLTLNSLLHEFDSLMLSISSLTDTNAAYLKVAEDLSFDQGGTRWVEIDNQLRQFSQRKMTELEDDPIFEEIWVKGYGRNPITKDTVTLDNYPSVFENKYPVLLNTMCRIHPEFKKYREYIRAGGDIGPTLFAGYPFLMKELDFNNEIIRLFTAIHFLTAHDERKLPAHNNR